MSAFNELHVVDKEGKRVAITFKYGLKYQLVYHVGDKIEPGDTPLTSDVEISGIAQDPQTGDIKFYAIKMHGDVIESYREVDESEFRRLP